MGEIEPGIYFGKTMAEYLSWPALSSHQIGVMIDESPKHYRFRLDRPREATESMILGAAAHCAVFEPGRFDVEYVARPESINRRTKQGKLDWENFCRDNAERTVLEAGDFEAAKAMRDAVMLNPKAAKLLESGKAEVSLVWDDEETGTRLRGRMDWLAPVAICELKTTATPRPSSFERQAYDLGYHRQAAMYLDGYGTLTGDEMALVYIIVENSPPHDVVVLPASDDYLLMGRHEYRQALTYIKNCAKSNDWPGYDDGTLEPIGLPGWVMRKAGML